MNTLHLTPDQIGEASAVIRRGGLLVFPTETVYGLGASAWDERACARIFEAKGRPADNPLIVHVFGTAMVAEVASAVPKVAERLFEAFSPGPLTVILPRGPRIPDAVTAGLDTVGVRIPSHPVAQSLLKASGMPVAAPSANRSGLPSPTTFHTAVRQMDGRVDAVIDGGQCSHGVESTIVRVSGERVRILREGAVTREMIEEVVGAGVASERAAGAGGAAEAPGTRHIHYRPRAPLRLVSTEELAEALRSHAHLRIGYIGLTPLRGNLTTIPAVSVYAGSLADYARRLYRSFYLFDAEGCELIVAERPAPTGVGRALRDRLMRAAQ
ncbi:MAG: L-threonylcarbamoyladenylate synthase [Spirochaetota bacterium]